jgi:hypothetical protein
VHAHAQMFAGEDVPSATMLNTVRPAVRIAPSRTASFEIDGESFDIVVLAHPVAAIQPQQRHVVSPITLPNAARAAMLARYRRVYVTTHATLVSSAHAFDARAFALNASASLSQTSNDFVATTRLGCVVWCKNL